MSSGKLPTVLTSLGGRNWKRPLSEAGSKDTGTCTPSFFTSLVSVSCNSVKSIRY